MPEGSAAVTTLNGVCKVIGVAKIVTQSPSIVVAEVTAYAVIRRYTPYSGSSSLFVGVNFVWVYYVENRTEKSLDPIKEKEKYEGCKEHLPTRLINWIYPR